MELDKIINMLTAQVSLNILPKSNRTVFSLPRFYATSIWSSQSSAIFKNSLSRSQISQNLRSSTRAESDNLAESEVHSKIVQKKIKIYFCFLSKRKNIIVEWLCSHLFWHLGQLIPWSLYIDLSNICYQLLIIVA